MSTALATQAATKSPGGQHVAVTREFPRQLREAVVEPATFDDAGNTVDCVFTRGARVVRYDWTLGRRYEEELVVTPDAVDMSRFDEGAVTVLNTHQSWELDNVIGVATAGRIANGEGRATLRLSQRPELAGIVADIKAGVIRNISVGYSIAALQMIEPEARADGGSLPLYRATRWQPMEISFVPVPADPGAGTRAAPGATTESQAQGYPCLVTRAAPAAPTQEQSMSQSATTNDAGTQAGNQAAAATQERTTDSDAVRAAAERDANTRAAEIIDLCKRSNKPDLATEYIRSGASLTAVRESLQQKLFDEDLATRAARGPNVHISTVRDEVETRRASIEEAINHRAFGQGELSQGAREWRSLSLIDMARRTLEQDGVAGARSMAPMEIAGRVLNRSGSGYMSTSDFSSILANVANKSLRNAYEVAQPTYKLWARRGENLRDFKPLTVAALSGAPNLLPVNEHGEFKAGSLTDAGTTYQAFTVGRIVGFTRQAMVNDDLGAFNRLISAFGAAAARYENMFVYGLITANGNAYDGNPIFGTTRTQSYVDVNGATQSATQKNSQSGGASALALTGLNNARSQMRGMRDPSGILLNLAPSYLLVGLGLEQTAYQLTSANYVPAQQSNINEYRAGGKTQLTPIVEPLLGDGTATAWWAFADPSQIDTVEYRYVDGYEGPVIDTEQGFDVDGMRLKCRLDYAAAVIDWRGLQYSAGV